MPSNAFDHVICNTAAGPRAELVALDVPPADHQLRHVQPDFVLVSTSFPTTVLLIELTVCGETGRNPRRHIGNDADMGSSVPPFAPIAERALSLSSHRRTRLRASHCLETGRRCFQSS